MNRGRLLWLAPLVVAVIVGLVAPLALGANKANGNDRVLSKITFIHYKKGAAKPPNAGGGKKDTGNYTYLASGASGKQ